MNEMTACANIYRAVMAYKRDTGGRSWSDNERKIIGMLTENGLII